MLLVVKARNKEISICMPVLQCKCIPSMDCINVFVDETKKSQEKSVKVSSLLTLHSIITSNVESSTVGARGDLFSL